MTNINEIKSRAEAMKIRDELFDEYQKRDHNACHISYKVGYADAKSELSDINSDGPELSCPYIDDVIKKYPDTATKLEYVRTINLQLRYERNGYAEMYNEIKKELAAKDKEIERLKAELAEKDAVLAQMERVKFDSSDLIHELERRALLAKEVLQKYRKSEG